MTPRTGRPPKGEYTRNINLNIRISKEEAEIIKSCANKLGKSRTDIIIDGVKMVEKTIKK